MTAKEFADALEKEYGSTVQWLTRIVVDRDTYMNCLQGVKDLNQREEVLRKNSGMVLKFRGIELVMKEDK